VPTNGPPFGDVRAIAWVLDIMRSSYWETDAAQPYANSGTLQVPPQVIEHRAILTLSNGTPFIEVVETYTRNVLAFPGASPVLTLCANSRMPLLLVSSGIDETVGHSGVAEDELAEVRRAGLHRGTCSIILTFSIIRYGSCQASLINLKNCHRLVR
jgi:hypothetical protein